jgi:hypothetical protein
VIFAGKVIEKRAFADVGGVGYVLHRSVCEAMLSEEIEGSTKQAFPDLSGTPLSAIWRRSCGGRVHVTINHA